MDRNDAFDVITDPTLNARTASLKRHFSLLLSAQKAYDEWYAFENPDDLAEALKSREFDPALVIYDTLLELSSSVESEMLRTLRDVGVGASPMGIAGIGVPQVSPGGVAPNGSGQSPHPEKPRRRGIFR